MVEAGDNDAQRREMPTVDDLWAVLREQRAHIDAQNERMKRLEAELEQQRMDKVALAHRVTEVEGGHGRKERRLSRAGLLKAAAVGAAGVTAAGVVGRPDIASATTATMMTGTNNLVDDATGVVIPLGGTYPADKDWILWADGSRYSGHNVDGLRGTGSASGHGVTGYAGATGGSGIHGLAGTPTGQTVFPTYTGVWGDSNSSIGVLGTSTSYAGVIAYGHSGYGLLADSDSSYSAVFDPGKAHLWLYPASHTGAPPPLSSGVYDRGAVSVDSTGTPYRCMVTGNPGTWVPMISLIPFPDPRRVFGQPLNAGVTTAAIDATAGSGVPVGAQAAYCAVQSYQDGTMTIFPDGAADPGIANYSVSGTGGTLRMLYMLVPLSSAGRFKMHTYFTGSVYVDVWGYLM